MASWIDLKREQNFIGGAWVGADSGKSIDVNDPASGKVVGTVPNSGAPETKRAIAAAKAAFEPWSRTTAAASGQADASAARLHHGPPGCPGRAADARTRQAAR